MDNSIVLERMTLIDQVWNEMLDVYNWVLHCSYNTLIGIALMGFIHLFILFRVS